MRTTVRRGETRGRTRAASAFAETFEPRVLFHFALHDPIADSTVNVNAAPTTMNLGARIFDETKGTTVRLDYGAQGAIDLFMLDYEAPLSVANFVNHVNAGTYDNTVIHRSEPGRQPNPSPFVIQGGGFRPNGADVSPDGTPTVPNEFSPRRSNVRGTVAYAKLANQPNSATTEYFFNLNDTNTFLDTQNAGFTVFARVLGNGMTVADAIVGLPRVNATPINGAWNHFPVTRTTTPDLPTLDPTTEEGTATSPATDQMVVLQDASVVGTTFVPVTFTVTNSNPSLVNPVVNGSNLTLNYAPNQTGTATITVTATEQGNPTPIEETFVVTVLGNSVPVGEGTEARTVVFQDADGTAVSVRVRGGAANLIFGGTGVASSTVRGVTTVTGTGLQINGMALSGNNPSVTITTDAAGDAGAVVMGLSADGPVGSVVGRSTLLLGPTVLNNGIGRIDLFGARNANIDINRGDQARLQDASIVLGVVENTSIDSQQPIRQLRVGSWAEGAVDPADTITTLRINSLQSAGDFAADINLSGNGQLVGAPVLGSARVGGAATGAWNVTGRVSRLALGSTGAAWTGTFGDVANLSVLGDLAGALTASSVNALGANTITNADINLTGDAARTLLNRLSARGAITGTHVRSAGTIGSVSALSMAASTVFAGIGTSNLPDGAPLPSDAAAFASPAAIRSVLLRNRAAPAFSGSSIAAATIGRANLGQIQTANNGVPFGLAAQTVQSVGAFGDGGAAIRASRLDDPADNIDQGDFEVRLF